MKKLRIRESKVEAFMKKRGYRDIYEMQTSGAEADFDDKEGRR